MEKIAARKLKNYSVIDLFCLFFATILFMNYSLMDGALSAEEQRCGSKTQPVVLTMHVKNIEFESNQSEAEKKPFDRIYLAIFNEQNAENFPGKSKNASVRVRYDIKGKQMIVRLCEKHFKDFSAGAYAATLFQDKDGDAKLSRNFLGIPTEPLGMSNDAKGTFGPPSFEEARFDVEKNKTKKITINLYRY